ncbi:SRR1-like protein isoform X3 [Phacochoerus africanus]|uniref:SRR1-like protein isoform X3 n=1 Tax=Phacochoerus africanus TaxID=41426 RepID=UPI001FD9AEE7|nr:SRR1-like protein isoform X3 [Phacochoerus africanus]
MTAKVQEAIGNHRLHREVSGLSSIRLELVSKGSGPEGVNWSPVTARRGLPSVSPRRPAPPTRRSSQAARESGLGTRDPEASETPARYLRAPRRSPRVTSHLSPPPAKVPAELARADDVGPSAPLESEPMAAAAAAEAAALASWQEASPRRRRSASRRPRQRVAAAAARTLRADPEVDSGVVLRRIREAGEDLLISDFWSLALETIKRCLRKHLEQLKAPVGTLSEAFASLHLDPSPDESDVARGSISEETLVPGACHLKCVCYGIGNFATCVIARNQLAFLLLFLEKCQIPRSHCWIYDPLFSQIEITVLNTLGVVVLSENEEGKRSVCGEPTVFYMLHCGTALYNNLLWSNWSVEALSKLVIIGNSFRGLEERFWKD